MQLPTDRHVLPPGACEDSTNPFRQPFRRKQRVAGLRNLLHISQRSLAALRPPCVKRSEMLHSGRLRSGLAWRHSPVMSCHRRWFYLPSMPDPPRPISASRLNGQARSIHYERHPRPDGKRYRKRLYAYLTESCVGKTKLTSGRKISRFVEPSLTNLANLRDARRRPSRRGSSWELVRWP